jgi:hypothetical protein
MLEGALGGEGTRRCVQLEGSAGPLLRGSTVDGETSCHTSLGDYAARGCRLAAPGLPW